MNQRVLIRIQGWLPVVVLALALAFGGCGDDDTSGGEAAELASSYTLKVLTRTGENPFAQLAYECNECSLEQFAAVEPPPGYTKSPAQVILPQGELLDTPSFEGIPSFLDIVPEIPGDDFELIARTIDGRIVEVGDDGIMAVVRVTRDTQFRFPAFTRVHELTDPDGNVFVLFAYEIDPEDFTSPDFQDAEALQGYPFPENWTYSTRVLDEDLMMSSDEIATVLSIQAEAASVWELR